MWVIIARRFTTLTLDVVGKLSSSMIVVEKSSLSTGVAYGTLRMDFVSPTLYTLYTTETLAGTRLVASTVDDAGTAYSFAASGNGVSIVDVSITYQGGPNPTVTNNGTPMTGTYSINSNGSVTITTATGYTNLAYDYVRRIGWVTSSTDPLVATGVGLQSM